MLRSVQSQFFRFFLAGAVAAAVNFASRIGLSYVFTYPIAIVIAFFFGITTAFILMRGHVFGASGRPVMHEIAIFVAVNALALLQTLIVSLLLAYIVLPGLGVTVYAETIAHLFGVAVPIITSYAAHKRWTFQPKATL
jgi:putative flippase GtrA